MNRGTLVRIDKDTKQRLETLAGSKPVARYLRELTIQLCGGLQPKSPMEDKLKEVENKINITIDLLSMGFKRKNKAIRQTVRKE